MNRLRQMIADALFQLMKRKTFEQISVTGICDEAAIGRKTFYRIFELREDVIAYRLYGLKIKWNRNTDADIPLNIDNTSVNRYSNIKGGIRL